MKKPYIIGITGGSGSGKSSLLKRIQQNFADGQVCVISQDEYYHPREKQPMDESQIRNFDLPTSIDHESFYQNMCQLARGEAIRQPKYNFNNPEAEAEIVTYFPAPILVVEGLFVFYEKRVRDLLDLTIFVHAKEDLKIIRRIRRDREERNYGLADVLYRYENHVSPAFEAHISQYREWSDIVINNNVHFENALRVLQGFLHWQLQQ